MIKQLIIEKRKKLKISQQQMADFLNVNRTTYVHFETNEQKYINELEKIFTKLQIEIK